LIKTHSRKTNAPEEEPVTIDTTDLLMTYNVNTDKKPTLGTHMHQKRSKTSATRVPVTTDTTIKAKDVIQVT